MGTNACFFVSDAPLADCLENKCIRSSHRIELCKWAVDWAFVPSKNGTEFGWDFLYIKNIPINSMPIPAGFKVEAFWINKIEEYTWCHEDEWMFRLILAKDLRLAKFNCDLHITRQVPVRMIEAVVNTLPDDWPIILYLN